MLLASLRSLHRCFILCLWRYLLSARGRHVGNKPSAGVASAGMMIFDHDCVASYPPSVCYRRALSGASGPDCIWQMNMSLAVYIMRFSAHSLCKWLPPHIRWPIAAMLTSPALTALPPAPLANRKSVAPRWQLALLRGRFGYIIVATYLPLMAKSTASSATTAHLYIVKWPRDHSRRRLAVAAKH